MLPCGKPEAACLGWTSPFCQLSGPATAWDNQLVKQLEIPGKTIFAINSVDGSCDDLLTGFLHSTEGHPCVFCAVARHF